MTFWNKNKVISTASLLSVLVFTACGGKNESNKIIEKEPYCLEEQFKAAIKFEHPVKEKIANEIHLSGRIEPNPENVVQFSNLVDGVIVKTHFSLGDYVQKGQVLAEVKSTELTEWQSRLRILTSELQVAQYKLESVQAMHADGISSKKELHKAESQVIATQSELEEIKANLELYNASSKSGVFHIKAPSSGYITEKNINAGMQVEAYGDALFTIAELSDVWVQINVYPSDLKNVFVGMKVQIESLSYPDSLFTGKIDAISHVLDQESGIIKARVQVHNRNLLLKPGMFVDVIATQETEQEALVLPLSALIFDNNKNYVVLYNGDCDLVAKEIDYIGQSNGSCYISLDDLNIEDRVITKEQLLIYEQIKNF